MELSREISITFTSGGYQNFDEVETGCTVAQITTLAEVCGSIVGGVVDEIEISDVTTLKFGSEA